MKSRRIWIAGFLGVLFVLLISLTIYLVQKKQNREAAIGEQDNLTRETAIGKQDNQVKEAASDEQNNGKMNLTTEEKVLEDSIIIEEPLEAEATMIDRKDQLWADQEEASMESSGENRIKSFYYEELTKEIIERINGKSYGDNCDVPYEDLRYVRVLHWGFDNQTHSGEMIVNKAIAEDVVEIFAELYEEKYPIERMVLVDEYDADDNTSMAANNSSAFNYRVIEGTKRISLHSYGMAIDINPLYNPYVHEVDGERVVTPVEGAMYEDRSLDCPYYIRPEDVCYQAFIKRGFTWGGDWKNKKDYQHFQKELVN